MGVGGRDAGDLGSEERGAEERGVKGVNAPSVGGDDAPSIKRLG